MTTKRTDRVSTAGLPARVRRHKVVSLALALVPPLVMVGIGFAMGASVRLFLLLQATGGKAIGTAANGHTALIILVPGLVVAAITVPMFVWSVLRGGQYVLRALPAKTLTPLQRQRLRNVPEELALATGVAAPRVLALQAKQPNAITVVDDQGVVIIVTSGLLDLPRQELQAVLAHELAHVVDSDARLQTSLVAVAFVIAKAVGVVDGLPNSAFFLFTVKPVMRLCDWLASLTAAAASRRRDLLADEVAVLLTRDPAALLAVLERLSKSRGRGRQFVGNAALAAFAGQAAPDLVSGWRGKELILPERALRVKALAPAQD